MTNLELINSAKESALAGKILDKEHIIALLDIDPKSEECKKLGEAAREIASEFCKDRAYIWAAIGVDYKPCKMNCHYCSLGEKWGIVKDESELSEEEIVEIANEYVQNGVRWIVLRTTEFYSVDKLIKIAKRVRKEVPGEYELGANIGEFDRETTEKMVEAGLEFVYHNLRIREGKDTNFDPNDRIATLEAIKNSPLKLGSFVEPIGIEHTNEEIADAFLNAMKFGAVITGGMARVPVSGTPLGELPAILEERFAQIVAIIRLAAGSKAPDICVHKASKLAINWGANVAVVEKGSISREANSMSKSYWNGFDPDLAKKWFNDNGYQVFSKEK